MGLLRKLLWIVFFLISTLCFVVLFEHGTRDFPKNVKTELENIKKLYNAPTERKKDESDAVTR